MWHSPPPTHSLYLFSCGAFEITYSVMTLICYVHIDILRVIFFSVENIYGLDIVVTVYHLVIYMQSNKIHKVI